MQSYRGEIFDIILQGGQSNAEGCGVGPVADEYKPDGDILYMVDTHRDGVGRYTDIDYGNFDISVAEERIWDGQKVGDFALSFAEEYKRKLLEPGRRILIVRTAVGGTGWGNNRWGMGDDLYLNMMAMLKAALELNPGNRLKAFLWHQGETDVGMGREHYDNLLALVKSVYEAYSCVPFIAGDFVNEWKLNNLQACEPTVQAIRDVCRDLGGAFVETADLLSNNQEHGNGDEIHFSRNALGILGKRYFEAYAGF